MIDREKVIRGLECCADWQRGSMHRFCEVCPYNDNPVIGTCNNLFPLFRDAFALLKADQAYLLWVMYALQMIVDDAYLYGEPIAADAVRRLINQIRNVASHGVPEEVTVDATD